MNKKNYICIVCIGFFVLPEALYAGVRDHLIEDTSNNLSCYSYKPYLGNISNTKDFDINSTEFELTKSNKLILNGDVVLDFNEGLLKAGSAIIDRDKNIIEYTNDGYITLSNGLFSSKSGLFDQSNKALFLTNGEMFIPDRNLIISFDELSGGVENDMNITGASITSCGDPSEGWSLEAKSLNIDNVSKRGLAKNLTLKLFDKNVLYLPWIPFSISSERTSGFLEPSLSYSSDGLDATIPYYRVLSSSSDLTIAPRIIANRGTGLELNIRKAHNKKFLRNLDLTYLSKDTEFSREFEEKKGSRWAYSLEDSFQYKNYFGYLDWSKSSDQMVLRDIPGENISIGNQRSENLAQTLFFKASYSNLDISLKHEGYQSLNPILTNGYKKSPEVDINYQKNINQYNVSYRMNYAKFDADLIHGYFGYKTMGGYVYRNDNPIEGSRIYSSLNIENKKIYKNLKISSELGFKNISYGIKNSMMDVNDVTVPNALVKLSSSFFNSSNGSVKIIEPKLVLGYVGYEDQINNPIFDSDELSPNNQLFNNHRFSGLDRIGDQKFYTFGLSYQKIVSGMKKVKIDISKKIYLEDRKVWINPMTEMTMTTGMTMHAEPIVAMASFMPKKNSMIMMYGGLDEETDSMMLGGLNLKKSFAKGSLGYSRRYRRMAGSFNIEMDYSEAFAAYKITQNIDLLAKLKRDHATDINIESLVGLKYQNCCIGVQLTISDKELSKYIGFDSNENYQYLDNAWNNIIDIENKSRINLSFELKGFNSSFDKMSRLFNNSLLNY